MEIVTYARVSTIRQETEGQSLINQEDAFQAFLHRSSARRLAAYAESKSAKSVDGRQEFLRLIDDLRRLKPDLVVVDSIDRFSRNLQDGLNLLERFRGQGIRLLPLDWLEPINMDDDRDWKSVVQELTGADYERRRIRARVNRSVQARRERGVTLHSRPPFGLLKSGDALVPDPKTAPLVAKIDRMFLRGKSVTQILAFVQSVCGDDAWTSRSGPLNCLKNVEIVKCGLRTPATQARINARFDASRIRYGRTETYVHAMTGLFACGICVDQGADPSRALFIGRWAEKVVHGHTVGPAIGCNSKLGLHPSVIAVRETSLEAVMLAMMKRAVSDSGLRFALRGAPVNPHIENLLAQIASTNASAHTYRKMQATLIAAMPEHSQLATNIKQQLMNALENEANVADIRTQVLSEVAMSACRAVSHRDPYGYLTSLAIELSTWREIDNRGKNAIAKMFCETLGSRPIVFNAGRGHPQALVTWYEVFPDVVWRVRHGLRQAREVEILPRVVTG